jgi:hypothetical protein
MPILLMVLVVLALASCARDPRALERTTARLSILLVVFLVVGTVVSCVVLLPLGHD